MLHGFGLYQEEHEAFRRTVRAVVDRIAENCEPALCSVLFMGGAGGSLRAGVTTNPVRLTRSVKDMITRVLRFGAPPRTTEPAPASQLASKP